MSWHVEEFAEESILRCLDLDNTLIDLDSNHNSDLFQEVLDVIGILPNLNSFGILLPSNHHLLQSLISAIENWEVRHFK